MKTRVLLFICLAPALAACATTKEYGQKFSGWVGQGVDELYAKFGTPSSTQPQADGGNIVSYERQQAVPAGSQSPVAPAPAAAATEASAAADSANIRIVSCTTRYKTDSSGVIRSWTFDGEGCKAHEAPPAP